MSQGLIFDRLVLADPLGLRKVEDETENVESLDVDRIPDN